MSVNIVYPIDGASYPISNPVCRCEIESAHVTASFSATCAWGDHHIEWGLDDYPGGKASFYDQFSAQFVYKLPAGTHKFWVSSDCGEAAIEFTVRG